jgi:hypothetical protein
MTAGCTPEEKLYANAHAFDKPAAADRELGDHAPAAVDFGGEFLEAAGRSIVRPRTCRPRRRSSRTSRGCAPLAASSDVAFDIAMIRGSQRPMCAACAPEGRDRLARSSFYAYTIPRIENAADGIRGGTAWTPC